MSLFKVTCLKQDVEVFIFLGGGAIDEYSGNTCGQRSAFGPRSIGWEPLAWCTTQLLFIASAKINEARNSLRKV